MKTKNLILKTGILLIVAMLFIPKIADAQTPKFRVMLTVVDSLFDTDLTFKKNMYDTTVFGLHQDATYCTDVAPLTEFTDHWTDNWRGTPYTPTMTEEEYPPEAPQFAFYMRNAKSGCPGNPVGYFNLIHQYISSAQLDTFNLKVKSLEFEYSHLTIKWPKVLSEYFTAARITATVNGILYDVNMFTDSSLTFQLTATDNPAGVTFKIYTTGPKVAPGPPAAPSLLWPANGATDVADTVTLQWSTATNPYSYRLQVSRDSTFNSKITKDTTLSREFYKLSSLLPETTYYWRVSVRNAYGISYYPVSPFRFKIKTAKLPPPVRIYPGSDNMNVPLNPTFRWYKSKSTSTVTYRIQISANSGFSSLLKDSTTTDTVMTVGGIFTNCNNYYWRINATNDIGPGDWSTGWTFKAAWFTPAIPALVSPNDGVTGMSLTPTLSWTGDICTENFRLIVAKDTDFTQVIYNSVLTQTSQTLPALSQDTKYFWKVKSKNSVDSSDYSTARNFTTILNPAAIPEYVSPANGDTNRNPVDNFVWRKVQYADIYHVQIALDQNFTSLIANDSTLTDTSFTTPSLNNCVTYYWHVRAKNRSGSAGYSALRNFKIKTAIAGAPVLDNPVNGKDSLVENVTLQWHAGDPCTNSYYFHVSRNSSFTDTVMNGRTSSTTFNLTGLAGNVYYFWHVRAVNYLGDGAYSETFQFHTTKSKPLVPALLEPVNDLGDVSSSLIFKWDSATFASTYRLQIARDSNFTNLFHDDSLIARVSGVRPSKQVDGLPNAIKMYWRVNAKNEIADIILNGPVNGEEEVSLKPTFSWSLAPRAIVYQLQVARDTIMVDKVFDDSTIVEQSWSILNSLNQHTKYFWRVRGKNSAGWGNWTSVYSFTTTRVGIANWLIPLTVAETGPERQTIYFGLHPEATAGIDPARGEYELPPVQYGYFDSRFISSYIGEGLLVEYHKFTSYKQRDTFQFRFQPGMGAYPMTISWYKARVKDVCDSMVITDRLVSPTLRVRMDVDSFIVINNSTIQSMYLISYNAYPFVGVEPVVPQIPKGFVLYQNYPNPFNPSTKIHFTTDKESRITIAIFDMLGREISVLTRTNYSQGAYTFEWNGKNADGAQMPSGVYYVRMIAAPLNASESGTQPFVSTRKMIMMK
jgi:hypothetical protein